MYGDGKVKYMGSLAPGVLLITIARDFAIGHSAISDNFARFGDIRPPERQRFPPALTLAERE